MDTYSYCKDTDICFKDSWNYIPTHCKTGWKRGIDYDFDYCPNVEKVDCPSFDSDETLFYTWTNTTWSLVEGGYCTVQVDATDAETHVIFEENEDLGLEYHGAIPGELFTIYRGV